MVPARPSSRGGGPTSNWRRRKDGGGGGGDDDDDNGRAGTFSQASASKQFPLQTRSNSDSASGGIAPRDSSIPRSLIRRSLAMDSTRGPGPGHGQHVLFPILSRDPAAGSGMEDGPGRPAAAAAAAATATDSVRAATAQDKAARHLRESIRRLRSGKTRDGTNRALLHPASRTEAVRAVLAAVHQSVVVEGLLRRRPLPRSHDGRHIPLNPTIGHGHDGGLTLTDERSQKPYIGNFIRSSRYTVYDFVPKQLLFQFSKLGNFYFLIMGVLQMIPGLSTVGRFTTIGPLLLFVAFSMAKEGYDDYRRYGLDKSENRSVAWVLDRGCDRGRKGSRRADEERGIGEEDADCKSGTHVASVGETRGWKAIRWQDIRVGDVVRLRRDDGVPADMILLHATGPNGIAYIETMALDGETNLKSKQGCPLLAKRCATLDGIRSTRATIVSEDPNMDLYSYDGRVTVGDETGPLALNNIVYRGSMLRNTAEAIGIVVNTGEECKIRMNANRNATAKKPAMHAVINMMVLFQIVIVLMLATGFTIGYALWKKRVQDQAFYLVRRGGFNASVSYKDIFFGYLVMFNTLIPLSLYISMEIVKLGQLVLLQDVDMYDPATDTPVVANTTTILENLGQVTHVFSDKTGTLTENCMRFRKMSVAGVACLHDMDVQRDEQLKREKMNASMMGRHSRRRSHASTTASASPLKAESFPSDKVGGVGEGKHPDCEEEAPRGAPPKRRGSFATSASRWRSSVRPGEEPEVKTEDVLDYMRRKPNTMFSRKVKHLLLSIALCHTCVPEKQTDGGLSFQAASPDELALVEAAWDLGWLVVDRPGRTMTLQTRDEHGVLHAEVYQVLDVIGFSSKRKRMSIIVRMADGRICVFCKGADNVILARLKMRHVAEQKFKDMGRRASVRKTFEQDKARSRMSMASVRGTPRTSMASFDRRYSLEGLRRSLGRRSTDLQRLSLQQQQQQQQRQQNHHQHHLHRRQHQYQPLDGGGGDAVSNARLTVLTTPRGSTDLLRHSRPSMSMLRSNQHQRHGRTADQRIEEAVAADEATVFEKCFQHVDEFASQGLRTLLYASRYIDEETYASWKALYREAETSLANRQEMIEEAGDVVEQKLELAGATAIEDKLQEGVPETVDKLRRANVKVWMLTGDKRETAINIGHSARVCKPFSEIYILDGHHRNGNSNSSQSGNLQECLTATLNDVGRGMVPHSVVVVDGQTLSTIDGDEALAMLFYDLVLRVDSVICCRASPSQKANLVRSVRRLIPESMTLAIGDGANDIGMIQASHVGIGISGREGLQAARIADYSIAQFRFLQPLLFVHGRWNYLRTGKYILATFWKEIIFFLAQAHYQRFNGYSGTSLFEPWSLTVFNSLFTSLPVLLLGILDKDLAAGTLLAVPELYGTFGPRDGGFCLAQYCGWMAMGVAGSFVIYYFAYGGFEALLFSEDPGSYALGALCFTVGVIFINAKLLILELHHKTVITLTGFFVSVAGWFLWCIFLSGTYPDKIGKDMVRRAFLDHFGRRLSWWTTLVLALGTLVVVDLVVQAVRRVYWPTDRDLMQRVEREGGAVCGEGVEFRHGGDIEMQDMGLEGDWI